LSRVLARRERKNPLHLVVQVLHILGALSQPFLKALGREQKHAISEDRQSSLQFYRLFFWVCGLSFDNHSKSREKTPEMAWFLNQIFIFRANWQSSIQRIPIFYIIWRISCFFIILCLTIYISTKEFSSLGFQSRLRAEPLVSPDGGMIRSDFLNVLMILICRK